jgi:hypothetical protein
LFGGNILDVVSIKTIHGGSRSLTTLKDTAIVISFYLPNLTLAHVLISLWLPSSLKIVLLKATP